MKPDEPTSSGAIQRRKLYQDVMERLMALIRNGGLSAGDQLPSERDLMERYGVGRPAVREALQNMAQLGLISIAHGERARVAEPSFGRLLQSIALTTSGILHGSSRSLEDLKEARLMFEIQMVRRASERATSADIVRLKTRFDEHRASLDDLSRFFHHDMLFHREIAAITGNAIFPGLSEAVMGWLAEFHTQLVRLPGTEQLTLSEHAAIVDAIAAHDAEAAERAMRDHILRANALYAKHAKPSGTPIP
jgi:GntR family transcriptional regulator, sialic acid-inducible nan operon repressor